MSRGKYGARAAVRRESAEITTTIEDYKRAVVKLTQERDKLAVDLAKEQATRSRERRELRAMVSEGAAPELAARDRLIRELRQIAGDHKSYALGLKGVNHKLWNLLRIALREQGIEGEAMRLWAIQKDPTFSPGVADAERALIEARMTVSNIADDTTGRLQAAWRG